MEYQYNVRFGFYESNLIFLEIKRYETDMMEFSQVL